MKESLRDLLGRGADSIDPPDFDVNDLVAQVERRLARRRLTALAATVVTVAMVGAGTFALSIDREPPAPPGPSEMDDRLGTPRALVYAERETIHFGDQTFDAGADVVFVEATDDGVVFITEDDYQPGGPPQKAPLWFTDGSDVEQIGVTDVHHVYDFAVATANPGSLVAWLAVAAGADTRRQHDEAVVVYDTRRHRVVARVPVADSGPSTIEDIEQIAVNGDRVYWENGAVVTRYDVSTETREAVSWEAYHADLARNPRMLAFGNASDQRAAPPPVVAQRLAAFMQEGDRLVPTDSIHYGSGRNEIPTTRVDGQPLELRLSDGYEPATGTRSYVVVQWLDDDTLVLFAYHEHNELPMHVGDILVCPVPSGTCEVVVPASDSTPYVPPGDVY